MKNWFKTGLVVAGILALCLFIQSDVWAQCPMCRMSAESNLKNGGTDGLGLNTGILYMFFMPYILVAALGFWWWRNRKKQAEEMEFPGSAN